MPRRRKPPRTTRRPPSWAATSSAASPATTSTATIASPAPLPPPPAVHDAGPGPPRDPPAPQAPARLLHPADHYRPPGRAGQDRAKARLPLRRAPALLRPAHRRRTRLRHRQGPRQQQHQPRLVPPDGTGTPDAVHHHHADRPQPAHPGRLERPPGRQRAPRRRRPAPENPQTPPQEPH